MGLIDYIMMFISIVGAVSLFILIIGSYILTYSIDKDSVKISNRAKKLGFFN